ncbi:hypothetical protein C1645_875987 [Glomus cerebriforme]|uniref:Inner kinetochore subunit AME1 domain-containing protein n=1 Tax=Glomus cerebriforme TaxID=658196 RepID=A0A397T676_9GLOM|nr:hypothetical protein C1645_875987 [Glomus cerebriforme]
MAESKGLELTFSNFPQKYKERMIERRRTHGTRRTTFRDFKIILPPRPAEQPRTPEQILQRSEPVFDFNFNADKSSKRKSVYDDDDDEYEQLATPTSKTSKIPNNDFTQGTVRSRSSQMSFGSPMEIDYSINVGNIEVLISKAKFDEEQSDIVMMDEVDISRSPEEQLDLDNVLDEVDIQDKEQIDIVMDEVGGDITAKSSGEQFDMVTDEEVVLAKSSEEQEKEQITEEREINQPRKSLRHKNKVVANDKTIIPVKSPEQSDIIMDEEVSLAKSSEIEVQEEHVIEEKEMNQTRKSTRRKNNVVKDKIKDSTTISKQLDIIMDEEVAPAKSSEIEVQEEQVTEEREMNQPRKSTRRKNNAVKDKVKTPTTPKQDIIIDEEVVPAKSSKKQEHVTEERETNQTRKSTRRKNNVVAKDKVKIPTKSPEQLDMIVEEVVPAKSSKEQEQIAEEREISQSKKRPSRRKNKVGRGVVKDKGKKPVKSQLDIVMDDEDIPAISPEDQDVSQESINQPFEETRDPEEASEEEQVIEEREINQSKKRTSRRKIKCHKIGQGVIQDKDGNTVKKTSAAKLNELDVVCDSINDIIAEFLSDNSFKKEIQYFRKEIESNLLEQSDLLDEQIMLRSSLRQSKTRMNGLRKELLDVQRERDKLNKELANERRTFAKEEQDRKKLEQAHNFLTDLETLREAVDAEDNMQEDEEGILDGFKGLLVSVTSRKGSLDVLSRFNMLLEVCEKIIRQDQV